jgi:membrane protease YdiL (CAAX protease family)
VPPILLVIANLLTAPEGGPLGLPTQRLPKVDWFNILLAQAPIKALLPVPILIGVAYVLWRVFRGTWRLFDWEATWHRVRHAQRVVRGRWGRYSVPQPKRPFSGAFRSGLLGRSRRTEAGSLFGEGAANIPEIDYRPAACFVITAVVLTMQEYYGGRGFYDNAIEPLLRSLEKGGWSWLRLKKYGELYGYSWWVAARVIGYVVVPVAFWKVLFPKDSILDLGLRIRGFVQHLWIYGLCLAVVLPVMVIVAQQPDFGSYYPFYKNSSRSWFDFALWESMYWLQFLALEFFFRGWMVGVLRRSLGAAAVFAMAVPYCMIHYGKPYLEAHGAIVAGVVLGSLAMRTRSIYAGFLLHITVAVGMDALSLWKRGALPTVWWPPG